MGNKRATKGTRRVAAFLAALGVLVMSSGVALMLSATPANAAQGQHVPVGICHATSSDTNPYVFITVDDDSAKFRGHLKHRDDPNKHWKTDGTYELGGAHSAGDLKRDYIASFVDSDGVAHNLDGDITAASCDDEGDVEVPPAVVDVDFTDPTCDAPDSGSFDVTGDHATFVADPDQASYSIGYSVTITASPEEGFSFDDGAQTVFEHTFAASDAPCESVTPPVVTPPVVSPPKQHHTKTQSHVVTPTVVHAGLAGVTVQDMRGEQGMALTFAGMLLLVAAGGLGLRVRGSASRI